VLAPAIGLAENGFPVSPRLAESLAQHKSRLAQFPATRAVFFDTEGNTLPARARLIQKDLASTFRAIAARGSAAFYQGGIAADIVRAVNESPVRPGKMSLADLAAYDAPLRAPAKSSYRLAELYGMGPPSSGGPSMFELLNLLEWNGAVNYAPRSFALAHTFVHATRQVYADRELYLADADWVNVPAAGLMSKEYARDLSNKARWLGPLQPVAPGRPPGADHSAHGVGTSDESVSTTHLVVVDAERNIAMATTTIEMAFGSGIVVPGRGFLLNNELTDFSAVPVGVDGKPVANRIEGGKRPRRTALDIPDSLGGKRPRSSMAPTLVVLDGKPLLAIGSPGGPRIIQYVAKTILLTMDQRMPLQRAVAFPHLTHLSGVTAIEPEWGESMAEALTSQGHDVKIMEQNSGLHGVWFDPETGMLHAGVDPRREGLALGY
jgi:gamma-glutamyltranspeptidase/glutathione hydrolase